MARLEKPLVWLHGEIKSPPFSPAARLEAGVLFRQIQNGARLTLPHSRPMPAIGSRCHELRIQDQEVTWRLVYRLDPDAIVIADVFSKKTRSTRTAVIEACRRRLRLYDELTRVAKEDR
jgi:phage-related protein